MRFKWKQPLERVWYDDYGLYATSPFCEYLSNTHPRRRKFTDLYSLSVFKPCLAISIWIDQSLIINYRKWLTHVRLNFIKSCRAAYLFQSSSLTQYIDWCALVDVCLISFHVSLIYQIDANQRYKPPDETQEHAVVRTQCANHEGAPKKEDQNSPSSMLCVLCFVVRWGVNQRRLAVSVIRQDWRHLRSLQPTWLVRFFVKLTSLAVERVGPRKIFHSPQKPGVQAN